MYAADGSEGAGGAGFASVAEALRAGGAFADFLNSPAAAGIDGLGCGEVLRALGEIQGKLAAAYASFLRRFDAAGGHAADGYGSASAWLAARGRLTRRDARAAVLRQGLLDKPYNTPSLPLDIGYSDSIPWYIRRAVLLRDRTCAWPRCDRPAAHCDVHHLRHKGDGGETSAGNCVLVCQFHHDFCIHRRGWQLILHPDGTTEARSPGGKQILYSHAPPAQNAA